MNSKEATNYPVKISFDPEERLYVAEYFDLPGCSASGDTVEEAYQRAETAKDEWLRLSAEQGLPIPKATQAQQDYSGRILARVPSGLHGMLSDKAKLHGVSLNQYIVHLLSAGVVGDEISFQMEQVKTKLSQLEWRIGQLAAQKQQPVQQLAVQKQQPFQHMYFSCSEVIGQHLVSTETSKGPHLSALVSAYNNLASLQAETETEPLLGLIYEGALMSPKLARRK
jgi:antitoxin HicB